MNKAILFLSKHWAAISVVLIVLLSFYVRTMDYRWPYLRNIDSYSFMRSMQLIVDNGGWVPASDELIMAPYGAPFQQNYPYFYQYLGAWSYMLFRAFMPALQLWQYLIYFPAFLASLMAIPMYFIGKILYDKRAGVIAALLIVLDTSIMSRTLGGDPDSDAFIMLLPLVVMALFLLSYKLVNEKGINRRSILYTVITGIMLGVWDYSWAGWWYVEWLITGFVVLRVILDYAQLRNIRKMAAASKNLLLMYLIIIAVCFAVTVPILGMQHITATITGPFGFGSMKSEDTEMPNVYVSVAEMQESGGIADVIVRTSVLGGLPLIVSPFALTIYCVVYLLYSGIKKRHHLDMIILLLMWIIGPMLATITAVRFAILFSPPLAIGSAIMLSKLWRFVAEKEKMED